MKTLLLMRHAKSSWKEKDIPDHERPLNKRGRHDVPMMGELLVDRELVPQRIISSTAVRSRQTAEGVAKEAGFQGDIIFQDRLYMAEAEEYIHVLRELPDDLERVMIVGHNPGLEVLLQLLSGRIESLSTAVIAHLVLPIDHWESLNGETEGEMVEIWRPKDLREMLEEAEEEVQKTREKEKEKDKEKGKKKAK